MLKREYDKKMAELKQQIEALEKVSIIDDTKRFVPDDGSKYYYIDDNGEYMEAWWADNCENDENRFLIGNCFKTIDDALFAFEKLKITAELKNFAESNDAIWNAQNMHYYFAYSHNYGLIIEQTANDKHAGLYFASKEDGLTAIEKIGKDRILKYYLEVNNEG